MTGSHSPSGRYAAFFDLDGTLAVDNAPPSPADRDAIRAFRSRGNAVFLCTGRAPAHLYPAILDIGFDGVVAGAGAHITLGGQTIFRRFLSEQTIRKVADFSARTGYVCVLEGETGMFQISHGDTRLPWPRAENGADFRRRYPHEIITKLTYFRRCDDALEACLSDLHVIRHPDYVEAVPAGCSKSDGMRRVLEALRIPRENSLAFGDSMNDLDMIAYAGLGVAMGNAADPVKAAADRVTRPLSENGVAVALRDWQADERVKTQERRETDGIHPA